MCGGGLVRGGVGTLRPNIKECLHSDWLRAGAAMEKVKLVFNSRNCQRGKFCHHSSSGFPRSIFQRYWATGKPAAHEPQSATTPKAPPSVTGEHSWFCDGATVCLENLRLRHEPFSRTSHRKDAQQEQRKDLDSVPYYTHLQILFLWYNKRRRLTSGTSQQKHQQTCIFSPAVTASDSFNLTFLLPLKGRNNHKVNPGGPRSFLLGPSRSDISQKSNNRLYRTSSWISDMEQTILLQRW